MTSGTDTPRTETTEPEAIEFPPFRLDLVREELFRGPTSVRLRPKTFAVLCYLAARPGKLVTKDELLEAVWPDVAVTDDMPRISVRELREALGDDRESPRFIQTVPRRGYRFVAQIGGVASREEAARRSDGGLERPERGAVAGGARRHALPTVVGRGREVVELHSWLDAALDGEQTVGFVTGEVGIGKTTLVDAFLSSVASSGSGAATVRAARGQCIEQYGVGEPYLPVLDALGDLGRKPEGAEAVALLRRRAPPWLVDAAGIGEIDASRPRGATTHAAAGNTRQRMLRVVASTLEALAAKLPLVLVLEDIHWSDYSTVDLLSLLARPGARSHLLVLCTFRRADAVAQGHPVAVVARELKRKGLCREVPLDGLRDRDVAEYLAERLVAGVIPPSLTRLFVESTEGNPFFMIALADHLLARGLLVVEAGTWTLMHGPAEHMLPDSLRAALEPRLERLSSEERTLLETAAAAGVEFTTLALADAAADGAGIERVEELCDALEQREDILRRSGEAEWPDGRLSARYAFRHALYRQVVEQRAAPARRRRLHQEIGERIERAFAQATSRVAPELAAHFERSGDHARAVRYRMEAAGGARARFADQEVKLHLEAALDEVQKLPASAERDRLELGCLHDLGFALFAIEGYSGAGVARSFSALERVALRVGAPDALFVAKGGLFFFHVMRADLKAAEGIAREVTAMAEATSSAMLAAASHTAHGCLDYNRGELADARSHLEQARALLDPVAERFPVDMGIIHLSHLGLSLAQLGLPDQARSMSEAAKLRADSMSPLNVAYSRSLAAHLHAMLRDPAATRSHAEELIRLGDEYGFPVYAAVGTLLRGWAAGRDRRDPAAPEAIRAGIEEYAGTGQQIGRSFFLTLLADVALLADAVDAAEAAVREGLAHVAATGEAVHEAELLRLQAECRLRAPGAKLRTAAAEHFAPALAIAQRTQARLVELRIHASICRAIGPGKPLFEQARASLAAVLASFAEGLDCADLAEARFLLEG